MTLPPTTPLEKATLRWLKEFSGQGILITDDRLIIRGWNLWLETHGGKNADELIGEHLFEAFPDLVQRRLDRLYQEVLAGQNKVLAHLFHKYLLFFPSSISATHTPFMLQSAQITPLTDDSGNVVGTLTAIEDVSERVSRESALTQEKNLAQEYLDISGVMMLVLDTEGRVQLINKKGCEILGFSENEIIGKAWFEHFVPERERQDLLENFQQTMAGEDLIWDYVENFVVTVSGEEKLVAWHNSLLRDDIGKITGTLSSGEDITFRKEMEDQVIQARDEWVSTFNAAHDINERKRAEETARVLSLTDELTGLYNRRGFVTLADQQLKTASRACRSRHDICGPGRPEGHKRYPGTY